MRDIYDDIYDDFARMCPWMAKDVANWEPSDDMRISILLTDGSGVRYDGLLRSYRYFHKYEMMFKSDSPENEYEWRKMFAAKLYRRMKLMGYTQEGLSDSSGVNQGMINKYLNQDSIPSAYTVAKLAKALECPVDDLISI